MEKIEILNIIEEKLLGKIDQYHETRKLEHLTLEDIEILRKIWLELVGQQLQTHCFSCLSHCVSVIYSFYQRESKKLKHQNPEPEQNTAPIIVKKKCKDCKK